MIGISAQVSLYPLGDADLDASIAEFVEGLRAHGLEPQVGSMSTVVAGDDELVFAALRAAFSRAAADGRVVMALTVSNACPASMPHDQGERHG